MSEEESKGGFFGEFGGRFVPDELEPLLQELADAYAKFGKDPDFQKELLTIQQTFIGRPTPLLYAENATRELGGAKIYIKLEGLANTGAHKINNAVGQALLAKRMGKHTVIAETGAGQHGLASACAAARLGMKCRVYMGQDDVRRQRPNVFWMQQFGAEVIPVTRGSKTLTDAVDEAIEQWVKNPDGVHYLLGSALGPAPYPDIVRDFQSVIGREVKQQIKEREGRLPSVMVACVGGGSNSMGFFTDFLNDKDVKMVAVEAGGRGPEIGDHAARMNGSGSLGVFHGYKSIFLQEEGQMSPTHSISAGLDYAGIGPQLAQLEKMGRISFTLATDAEVIEAFRFFARNEGIIPALESTHALAEVIKLAPKMSSDEILVVNMSGRGDKDIFITAPAVDQTGTWEAFLRDEVRRFDEKKKQ